MTSTHLYKVIRLMTLVILVGVVMSSSVMTQSSAFSYQGVLSSGGIPANGAFDLQFTLHDAVSDGNQIGSTLLRDDVVVANGVFSVTLDFGGGAFDGVGRYLGIGVRPGSSTGDYTQLTPRVQLNAVPYAVRSLKATTADLLSATLPVSSGGTGGTTSEQARARLEAATRGVNTDITSLQGLTTPLSATQGGTGLAVGPAAAGQYLRSSAAGNWSISTINSADLPDLSGKYVDLSSNQTIAGNKTFSGNLIAPGVVKWQVLTTNHQSVSNRGYIANSSTQLTILLPPDPSVGDVVRINGFGSGGWRITAGAGQTLVSTLNSLTEFVEWIPRESSRDWFGVASSADGNKLVAIVRNGQIYTSSNAGVSWTPRESNRDWSSVASSADGTRLVAVGNNTRIYTSTDSGVTWTARYITGSWQSVASSSDGQTLLAASSSGLFTSTDYGLNWTQAEQPRNWFAVAVSGDGNTLYAADASGYIYKSNSSGDLWASLTNITPYAGWTAVATSEDGRRLAVPRLGDQIYVSSNKGAAWNGTENARGWESVAMSSDGMTIAAVAFNERIYVSNNFGLSWLGMDSNRFWSSIAMSADGRRMVAVVDGGRIYTRDFNSPYSLPTGSYLTGDSGSSVEIVYVGDGKYLLVSASGNFSIN